MFFHFRNSEIASFPVVRLPATINEKLVALLRRTAHVKGGKPDREYHVTVSKAFLHAD